MYPLSIWLELNIYSVILSIRTDHEHLQKHYDSMITECTM